MNIIAYTALHYGRDYLASAIRSVIDDVHAYYVLYTPVGSHGHRTAIPCPESEQELFHIAHEAAGDKLRWVQGDWAHEGMQRDAIHQIVPDADVVIALDSDEIWADGLLMYALGFAIADGAWRYRVPMIHYWRSFHKAVLHDPAYPERIIFPKRQRGQIAYIPNKCGYINHMGYAQRLDIVRYKLETHGHKGEFRRDCDWFEDVYKANRQTDCHVVGSQYWNPEPVNWRNYMPGWMAEHPYADKEVIE